MTAKTTRSVQFAGLSKVNGDYVATSTLEYRNANDCILLRCSTNTTGALCSNTTRRYKGWSILCDHDVARSARALSLIHI